MLVSFSGSWPWWNLRARQRKLVSYDLYIHRLLLGKYFQELCKLKNQIFNLITECLQCSSVLTIHMKLLMLSGKSCNCFKHKWKLGPELCPLLFPGWKLYRYLLEVLFEPSFILVCFFPVLPLQFNWNWFKKQKSMKMKISIMLSEKEFIVILPHTNQILTLFL